MIFATFASIIVPNNKYKKYIDMVTGLILIMIISKPIAGILNSGTGQIPFNTLFAGIKGFGNVDVSSAESVDYEKLHSEMLKQTYDELALRQMQSLLDNETKYAILSAEIEASEDLGQIKHISLLLQAVEDTRSGKPLIWIEPIRIGTGVGSVSNNNDPEIEKIKKIISDFYNLSFDNIHITTQTIKGTGDEQR